MDMIEELRETLEMEIRSCSQEPDYLEAVIKKNDLEFLKSFLIRHLGPAAKEPGTKVTFSEEIQGLVDTMGGLRPEQSFFYRQGEDQQVLYAALWPWESNPERITLKAGRRPMVKENR